MWPRLLSLGLLLTGVLAGQGCASPPAEETGQSRSDLASRGRWELAAEVAQVGAGMHVAYEGAPAWNRSNCSRELLPGTAALGEFVRDKFEGVGSIGGYSCRPNTANTSKMSVHGTGRAMDIMIPKTAGGANNGKGDAIATWLIEHAEEIGVQMIIWDRAVWYANGKNTKAYTGPHPHDDHLHVEVTSLAAKRKTAWFVNGGEDGVVHRDSGVPVEVPDESVGGAFPEEGEFVDDGDEPGSSDDGSLNAPTPKPSDEVRPEESKAIGTKNRPDEDDAPSGDPDSLTSASENEDSTRATPRIASSGCSVNPGSGRRPAFPMILAVAVATSLVRRRRRT